MAKPVSASEVPALLSASPLAVILDVRSRAKFLSDGAVDGAQPAPAHAFSSRHLPDDLATPVILVGGDDSDSETASLAARAATEWGDRAHVSWVQGGFRAWREAGLAVVVKPLALPSIKMFYESVTGTCQFVVTDDETLSTVILDSVLDFDPVKGAISTESADKILQFVRSHGLKVERIIETHVHADHLTAAQYLKRELGGTALVCIGEGIRTVQATFKDRLNMPDLATDGSQFDELFEDNSTYTVGTLPARVLNTPGHTSDSTSQLIGGAIFVGDSIFQPDAGTARCDFPGGDAAVLYKSISRLYDLPRFVQMYVGHDYCPNGRPLKFHASVQEQASSNMHIRDGTSLDEFVKVRTERDAKLGNPRLLFYSVQFNARAGHLPPANDKGFAFFHVPIKAPAHL
mgnify:CR=1 FL=1